MYQILNKANLNPTVTKMVITAPFVARKTQPGQFVILRIDEKGERLPFTVADYDREKGTVTIIFQQVGKATKQLGLLGEGDEIMDFVGPLGMPTPLEGIRRAAVVGGGLGCAIAWPQARKLFDSGAKVDIIAGFRNRDMVILEDEMRACSDRFFLCTDDGSYGEKGLVTNILERLIAEGAHYDCVIAIGPLPMMKFVSRLTKQYQIRTIVSMNPIMIDGTGMCGCCRVTVGGKTKFACVDGPDFDGHQIDFDEAMARLSTYKKEETRELDHYCRMMEQADGLEQQPGR
ncbi:MAG TPA: sulfide/dihydroorotate dehydrogenase-like FAD/NAD-binding protein [Clostridia bacterium]|nr:sulfide/dihydroorotate dehydrogenase-like FAD/NAD-binding protein [Clostridia bacterium]